MSYKKIKQKLVILDSFVYECGLFVFGSSDCDQDYICKSKSKEKQEPGVCNSYDCPLAMQADLKHLKELDSHLYEEHKEHFKEQINGGRKEEDCIPSSEYGSDWMVQYKELR